MKNKQPTLDEVLEYLEVELRRLQNMNCVRDMSVEIRAVEAEKSKVWKALAATYTSLGCFGLGFVLHM